MKKGILLKAKHEPDTTKFKLCVWYEKKLSGEYFTQWEKSQNKNRKYHDSIDFILTIGGNVTRHDEAYNKLLHHLEKWESHIERALMYMNDFTNDKQYLIGKFEKDKTKTFIVQPEFTHYKKMFYQEKIVFSKLEHEVYEIKEKEIIVNSVFATGLTSPPISEFKLKFNKTL